MPPADQIALQPIGSKHLDLQAASEAAIEGLGSTSVQMRGGPALGLNAGGHRTSLTDDADADGLTPHDVARNGDDGLMAAPKDEVLTPYLVKVALLAGCSGLLFGYDTGMAAGVLVAVKSELGHPLSAGEQELVVSATTAGAILGSLLGGKAADWLGRKKVIVITALLFLLGSLEQTASQDVAQLVLGRLIVGVAVGQAASVVPMYLAEVAPTKLRGRIVGSNTLLVTGGQVLAYLVNAALFPLQHSWRWMVLASALPSVVQLVGLISLDESPRWLVSRKRFAQARKVIRKIYPQATEGQVQGMIDAILRSLESNKSTGKQNRLGLENNGGEGAGSSAHGPEPSKWSLLFKEAEHRRALILAAGLQAFQQAVGFNAIMYYSSRLLLIAGFKSNPNTFATLIAIANFAGTVAAMRLVDSWGRRKLLLWTTAAMGVSLVLLAGSFALIRDVGSVVDPALDAPPRPSASSVFEHAPIPAISSIAPSANSSTSASPAVRRQNIPGGAMNAQAPEATNGPDIFAVLSLVLMTLYTLFYALGQGIVPWLVLSEVFSGQVRSLGSGLASCANWAMNLLWSATYLSFVQAVGPGATFGTFAAISACSWVFTYSKLPELTGVSINDVGRAFGGAGDSRGGGDGDQAAQGEDNGERQGLLAVDDDEAGDANDGGEHGGRRINGRGEEPESSKKYDRPDLSEEEAQPP
ncbi:unnamed protein product [Jaminaea pallidilutea]